MVLRVLHADRKRATLPDMAASLPIIHCSTACSWQVADHLAGLPTPDAHRRPRAVGTGGCGLRAQAWATARCLGA